jgi:hypothetical protein
VVGLLIAGFVGTALMLCAADRVLKARSQARRVRVMRDRLEAATVRADEQQARRQAAAEASAALTSVMPAIERPPLTLPGMPNRGAAQPSADRERAGQRDHRSGRPGAGRRPAHSGPHAAAQRSGQDERHRRTARDR